MKRLIPLLILFSACTKDDSIILPKKEFTLVIDSVLNQSGTNSLPKDSNGFYHLKLINSNNQTLSRVTGKILLNGKPPVNPKQYINWESNLYWYISPGDTL